MDNNITPGVLAIDDEKGLRDLLVTGLAKFGYRVITAANGEEGLEKLRQETFSVVLCDITMPGQDGIEVLKAVKRIRPKAEVIMLTGMATLETVIESMKQGAYDYIKKPFSLHQLSACIDKALEHGRLKARVGHLEELDRLKNEFLAVMNHELRTPINSILGFTSLLLNGIYGEVPQQQLQVLSRIQSNTNHLLHIITNILDTSKLMAGQITPFIESCNVRDIIKEVVESMQSLAQERKLQLTWDAPENLTIQTDRTRLRQILINLAGNGIKFTHQGGVSIKAQPLPAQEQVQIFVQDTGIGIAPENLGFLFKEFTQVDNSMTRKYGGTGLGLSICKKFAALLGGRIEVKSAPGAGSTFTVTLPKTGQTVTGKGSADAPAGQPRYGGNGSASEKGVAA